VTKAQRIAIQYAGPEYAISGRELEDVIDEVQHAARSGEVHWLEVSTGQGRSTAARLLLGPGIPIAVWQVNTDGPTVRRSGDDSPQIEAIAVD
jgi:hypothetical protein